MKKSTDYTFYTFLVFWAIPVIFAAKHTLNEFETWLVALIPAIFTLGLFLHVRKKSYSTVIKYCIGWSTILIIACLVVWATYTWSMGWRNI